jgi:N-glycosylase/DNA lyase
MPKSGTEQSFAIRDYDLSSTLSSGQAFRWRQMGDAWIGVIGSRWVSLRAADNQLFAQTASPVPDWSWLTYYLQLDRDLDSVLDSFPADPSMQSAVTHCRGLRLLRQDPWECLVSFILSSTKQIVQIQQIVTLLCERYGNVVDVPPDAHASHAFPTAAQIASLSESDLRACKMGFRAPYLLAAARLVDSGKLDLTAVANLPLAEAREQLMTVPGVGRKIADCVLLFAYDFPNAFPVDVWVMKALRQLYFPKRKPSRQRLERFTESYFGPHSGYAQQYLFHYMRTRSGKA